MKNFLLLMVNCALAGAAVIVLNGAFGKIPAVGKLLDPAGGLYHNARVAEPAENLTAHIPGLQGNVTVIRDERSVPHIFADHDLDAVSALGYAVAEDRLFQMDFIPRVAAGRLSEILGPSMIETDRFLRQTGMEWGARKNLKRILRGDTPELPLIEAYVRGVNAYISQLTEADYPLEFKLLGYKPEPYTPLHVMRILQYMTFDLTYASDAAEYTELERVLGEGKYEALYPEHAELFVPIIPEKGGMVPASAKRQVYSKGPALAETHADELASEKLELKDAKAELKDAKSVRNEIASLSSAIMARKLAFQRANAGTAWEGYIPGKGSNNWAVGPSRSTTDAPVIAGDMHLSLWLPAIWYEVHMVTPNIKTYGVTIPGAPLPVEGFNDHIGWAYTNTGSDQIDHLLLQLDPAGEKYRFEGGFRDLEITLDTLHVKGQSPRIDTLYYAHWGPVTIENGEAIALHWVAHDTSRTLHAQWEMNRANSFTAFQNALRYWDTPMQNIIFGDVDGNIAIRSTGYLPIRKAGHGKGLLDGSTDAYEWIGRVPFDELPYSYNPEQGFLSSTNQQPADSLYPYYQGHNWRPGYRSLRINALLDGKEKHSVADLKKYQADVYVVQRDLFADLLKDVDGLSAHAVELRNMLLNWEGHASIDRPEPLVMDVYLEKLNALVWDELVFEQLRRPNEERLYAMLAGEMDGGWLDIQTTPEKETAADIITLAIEQTAAQLETEYGWDPGNWRWGDHHDVVFRHVTRSEALQGLWRGPFEYPGFASTLSPASGRTTTHSASWRMVVDFSTSPPTGFGVYPGGQSGNPFSQYYDTHLNTYLNFDHYALYRPERVEDFEEERKTSVTVH